MIGHAGHPPSSGHPGILSDLAERIVARGSIPFDEFMDVALYGSAGGYYEREGQTIGPKGDFFTASDVSSAFGEMLAEQIAECLRLLGESSFDLVELGAGKGTTASDILDALERLDRAIYDRTRYWIVERASAMRTSQQQALCRHSASGKVRWVEGPDDFEERGITGCVLASEFYDALPVRIVARREGALLERRVRLSSDSSRLEWLECPVEDAELLEYATRYGAAPVDGTLAEAGLAARAYARRVARAIRKGFQIVIDYGDRSSRLFDPRLRPAGTLLGYYRHRTSEDPFTRVGEQDLTAHVNFSAIEDAGAEEGLKSVGFTTQDRFLIALGLANRIAQMASSSDPQQIRRRLAMMSLVHPEGMGVIFRVLVQAKEVPSPHLLKGLQDPFAAARPEETNLGRDVVGESPTARGEVSGRARADFPQRGAKCPAEPERTSLEPRESVHTSTRRRDPWREPTN